MSNIMPSPVDSESPAPQELVVRSEIIDLVVGVCLALLAAAFWLGAAQFYEVDVTGTGPATFPRGIAVLLGVGAILLVARALVTLRGKGPAALTIAGRPGHVTAGIVLVVLFPVLMTILGYYISTAILMPALFVVAGYRKPLGIIIYTAGFLAFARVAFEMILGVRLP
jgi:hypothetical protein